MSTCTSRNSWAELVSTRLEFIERTCEPWKWTLDLSLGGVNNTIKFLKDKTIHEISRWFQVPWIEFTEIRFEDLQFDKTTLTSVERLDRATKVGCIGSSLHQKDTQHLNKTAVSNVNSSL